VRPRPDIAEADGGALAPDVRALLANLGRARLEPMHRAGVDASRGRVRASARSLRAPVPRCAVADREIEHAGRRVGVRVYTPPDERGDGVILYAHGGGWATGRPQDFDALASALATEAACEVVSVDYRLSPESPFPAGLDDCAAVLGWIAHEHAVGRPVAVVGDSAGGNLLTVAVREAPPEVARSVTAQVLVYPVTDCDLGRDSYQRFGGGEFLLTAQDMAWFWSMYAPDEDLRGDARLSPLRSKDLSMLPPTIVILADHDPLLDEGRMYAEALARAGVAVEMIELPGLVHGFFPLVGLLPSAENAVRLVSDRLRGMFESTAP
jgi:acetyl esterase